MRLFFVLALCALFLVSSSASGAEARGIATKAAPEVAANVWFNLPTGGKAFSIKSQRGKVVVMLFFQSWCPGCHTRGFPTLKKLTERYGKGNQDIAFATIQTVFEGFGTNTAAQAEAAAKKFKLVIPVGHDAGPNESGSVTMRRYRSGGTPWFVVIDRQGVVRYNAFHIKFDQATQLIDGLLKQPAGDQEPK